jgi:hypothetical protein
MDNSNLISQVVSQIRDQRFLFFIAVIILVGGISFFGANPNIAWGVFVGGFVLIVIFTILDFITNSRAALRMSVALAFPQNVDATSLNLTLCEYRIQDPRNPTREVEGQVRPYPAGVGWLCPVPDRANPQDLIEMWLIDDTGKRWPAKAFVPENLWPKVDIRAQ